MKIIHLSLILTISIQIGYAKTPRKIINGENASILDFPYQVFLEIAENTGFAACGGTIIDNWHILTAAHCLYHEDSLIPRENITVITATDDLQYRPAENLYPVSEVTPHPNYNRTGTMENDIGILKDDRSILFNDRRKPARLRRRRIAKSTEVMLTGWGERVIDYTGEPYLYLQKLKTNVISLTKCRAWVPSQTIRPSQICTMGQDGASCDGDSGSPLSYNGVVVGIYSQGTCDKADPMIYTRVDSYLPWIRRTIQVRARLIFDRLIS